MNGNTSTNPLSNHPAMSTDFEEESLDDLVSQVRCNTVSNLLFKIFLYEPLFSLKLSWISVLWALSIRIRPEVIEYHSKLNLSLKSVSDITR